MGRNVVFTDHHLYFVTKKLHRLVEIDLARVVEKIHSGTGEGNATGAEEGKIIGTEVVDFEVDPQDGAVVTLFENGDLELIDNGQVDMCRLFF